MDGISRPGDALWKITIRQLKKNCLVLEKKKKKLTSCC